MATFSTQQWIAVLLIGVYAWFRYATPRGVRADTTWGKFFLGRVAYLVIALSVFATMALSPVMGQEVLKQVGVELHALHQEESPATEGASTTAEAPAPGESSVWLVAALMLIVLLSETPVLARIDLAIRSYFHRVASIPRERRRWIDLLESARVSEDEEVRRRVTDRFRQSENPLRPEDVVFERDGSARYLLTRATLLMDHLEQLASDRRYSGLLRGSEFASLRERFDRYQSKASACLELAQNHPEDRAVKHLERELVDQLKGLVSDLHGFAAGLVLLRGRTEAQRRLCVQALGLRPPQESGGRFPDPHAVLWLLVLLLVPVSASLSRLGFWKVFMITTTYWGAALSALLVREARNFYFPNRKPSTVPPIGYYLLAGGAGMLTAASVSILFRSAFGGKGARAAIEYFFTESWPWALAALTIATCIAVLTDDWLDARLPALHGRFDFKGVVNPIDGALVGAAVGLVALFAICPNVGKQGLESIRVALTAGSLGLILGLLVPTWVRNASRRSDAPVREPAHERPAPGVVASQEG